jgi:hypothetical protein
MVLSPSDQDALRLKLAKLQCMAKQAFVPSPSTQGRVQQQAQQGQPVQQGPNAQAIGASGITLDEVAQMIDQFYQEMMAANQQTGQQIIGIQQQINAAGGEGEKKSGDGNLEARLAQLEQMLGGTGAVAGAGGPPAAAPPAGAAPPAVDPQAAMAAMPVPGQPAAAPPLAQQAAPGAGMAPMPGGM